MYKKLFVLAIFLSVSGAAFSEPQVGTVSTTLHHLSAVLDNGEPSPANNGACHQLYQNYDNSNFTLNYSIDKSTLIESATAQFAGNTFTMHPEGLANEYRFISEGAKGDIIRVSAILDLSLTTLNAMVLFKGNDVFNCALHTKQ